MKQLFKLFSLLYVVCLLSACNHKDNIQTNSVTLNKPSYEIEKLTSKSELDGLSIRGDDDIVDWQLSKEFVQLWLEYGIERGDYPVNSELMELPILIYNTDKEIQFYEFRVVSDGTIVAAITGTARKSYGCPVAFESLSNGYYDKISQLCSDGRLLQEDVVRIVDNGYPSYVVGVSNRTKNVQEEFDIFINPNTGERVEAEDITPAQTYLDVYKKYPELVPEDLNKDKMNALVATYYEQADSFWKAALENKNHIADFAVRGDSKNPRNSLSGLNNVKKYGHGHNSYTPVVNYGPCGMVAAGFVLDYLDANKGPFAEWRNLPYYTKREQALRREINPYDWGNGQESCSGTDISNAIKRYSDYRLLISGYSVPKDAINNDLPGISLRVFGPGFAHYRPVIAYEQNGWWAFSWTKMKILDLVDCSDKINGSWETYTPIHHLACWNVAKK